MDQTEEIRSMLEDRKRDLQATLQRLGEEARGDGGDVQDEIDRVITSEAKTSAFEIGSREFEALRDVEAALARLGDGTYGRCVVCGKQIEPARLAAIPETPYCLEHADAGTELTNSAGY